MGADDSRASWTEIASAERDFGVAFDVPQASAVEPGDGAALSEADVAEGWDLFDFAVFWGVGGKGVEAWAGEGSARGGQAGSGGGDL